MNANVANISADPKRMFLARALKTIVLSNQVNESGAAHVNVNIGSGFGSPLRSISVHIHKSSENTLSLHHYEECVLSEGIGNTFEEIVHTLNHFIERGKGVIHG